MSIDTSNTVADIVKEDIRTAHVFKKHGIDFCCGGGKELGKVCDAKGIDFKELVAELDQSIKNMEQGEHSYDEWSPVVLADHIEAVHHAYLKENLPILMEYSKKVAHVHGGGVGHEYLVEMWKEVEALSMELLQHLQKEEMVLFPWIREMGTESGGPDHCGGDISMPIKVMLMEHDNAGDALKRIRTLSNDYTLPEYACNTWQAYFHLMEEIEDDTHLHIHLENNILFPKVSS